MKKRQTGNEINFVIEKDGFAIFTAPGVPMAVDSFNVATDLQIYVTRKNKQNKKLESILPDPLG